MCDAVSKTTISSITSVSISSLVLLWFVLTSIPGISALPKIPVAIAAPEIGIPALIKPVVLMLIVTIIVTICCISASVGVVFLNKGIYKLCAEKFTSNSSYKYSINPNKRFHEMNIDGKDDNIPRPNDLTKKKVLDHRCPDNKCNKCIDEYEQRYVPIKYHINQHNTQPVEKMSNMYVPQSSNPFPPEDVMKAWNQAEYESYKEYSSTPAGPANKTEFIYDSTYGI